MTDAEQREAARQFVNRWMGKGKEDEDGRSYWIDLLTNVLGMDNVTERLNFEKKVVIDGNTKRIDVYIPETRVIIEQKSLGKALDQKIRNSGDVDLTPFEQADRYNGKLTFDERARWIVTSNFAEIWIYDMNQKQPEPTKIALDELQSKYPLLDFLVKKEVKTISHEMEVSIKAGGIVGLIYDAFLKQYRIPDIKEKDETFEQKEKREHKLKSLNALCVRIVFCLYAEDAGIFGKRNMFHDYLETYEVKDCRRALLELFKILDTPVSERDEYLEEELAQFPYVNGGLFADETIEIPPFTEEIKELLLTKASEDFDWSDISPTIFGAVFESTLNPETRRSGGMHYTSIENIHKVISPLFLEDLQKEFDSIRAIQVKRTRDKKLEEFQNKLASLTFFDPACGSGNFLTETYLSLRRLENEVIKEKVGGQMTLEPFEDRLLYHNRKWTAEVFVNLLENAVKYTDRGGTISICVKSYDLYTEIQIADNGRGIRQEEMTDIFKRFYRSPEVENMEGSGIGLYLSNLILEKEKGYMTVDSEYGKGSCFSVFLQNCKN